MKHLICRAHTKEHIWTVHILNLANLTAQLDLMTMKRIAEQFYVGFSTRLLSLARIFLCEWQQLA